MRRCAVLWSSTLLTCATASAFVGDPCLPCHTAQVKAYEHSPMARSLARSAGPQHGTFVHKTSGTKVTITPAGKTVQIGMARSGVSGSMPVEYVIGSGNHAYGYLVRIGKHLFQAPVSYYAGRDSRDAWGMAPGFETDAEPDFTRPVTTECLQCHSGGARAVAGLLNGFESPPVAAEGITCDRC